MSFQTVKFAVERNVAHLTMNRPEVRNGLNVQMTLELRDAVRQASENTQVRLLVLTGAGGTFCSGADLGSINTDPAPARRAAQGRSALTFVRDFVNPMMSAFYFFEKPMIAAVNGPAVGGGIGLALVADIVVAGESARFMPKFTPQLALIPDLGSTWMLPRLVGRARALGMTLLGDAVTARQAEQWGLIWRCCKDADLANCAQELATRLANGPSFAMASAKRVMRESSRNDFEQQLRLEMELAAQCCASTEFCEAADAFLKKRPPVFNPPESSLNE